MSTTDPVAAPLRLSGSPATLHAPVAAGTPDTSSTLIDVRDEAGRVLAPRMLYVAGGQVKLRLDRATPPGRYAGAIAIGSTPQPVEIDIVKTVALRIRPVPLVIDLADGGGWLGEAAIENRGNVALTIDVTGHYPLGEELPVFPERSEPDAQDSPTRLADLFARTIDVRARRAMREAGEIALVMPEGPVLIEPGAAATIAVAATMPDGLLPTRRYRAFIPIYTEDLELVAITGTKQFPPERRKRAPSRGPLDANRDREGQKRPV